MRETNLASVRRALERGRLHEAEDELDSQAAPSGGLNLWAAVEYLAVVAILAAVVWSQFTITTM